jgi:signal transduction histidine kinase
MVYISSEVERPEYFEALKTQTRHLSQIATDMLDLVNVEEQGRHLFQSLNLNDLLDKLLSRFVARANAKGLHIIWQPKFGLPPIAGNLSQLELAFTTVIINAIDYTLTGHLSIHTRFNKRTNMVGCVVQDTGVGIDHTDMPHLFKRSYRGKTIPQTLAGMGLGLAIVKEIVNTHDGKIDIESQLGEGSMFTLWFPVSNISATQLRQDTNYQ